MSENAGALAHHFENLEQQRDAATLGMWAFLATEVLFFGGALLCFGVYRYWYTDGFIAGCLAQNVPLGTVNTIVLLTSSLTMALAVHAAGAGRKQALELFLALTIVLGAVFLGVKAYEYTHDYSEGLVPGASTFRPIAEVRENWAHHHFDPTMRSVELYFVFYFVLTGLHALHMVIGMAILGIMFVRARRGRYTTANPTPVEVMGLYWHFVDIVWIFLFPILYLLRH